MNLNTKSLFEVLCKAAVMEPVVRSAVQINVTRQVSTLKDLVWC